MDADAKQTVRDELLRRGFTVQDYNDCLIIASFIQLSWKHLDEGSEEDHYLKAKDANRRRMRQIIGDELYDKHISSITNPERSNRAQDYIL